MASADIRVVALSDEQLSQRKALATKLFLAAKALIAAEDASEAAQRELDAFDQQACNYHAGWIGISECGRFLLHEQERERKSEAA